MLFYKQKLNIYLFFYLITLIIEIINKIQRSWKLFMYELKNHTEITVHKALRDYLRNNRISCSCERCQADIMALALNRLPARYYISLRGEIMTQWELQTPPDQARVMADVVRAAQQVSTTPSHPLD
jgi:competence protein ComFB